MIYFILETEKDRSLSLIEEPFEKTCSIQPDSEGKVTEVRSRTSEKEEIKRKRSINLDCDEFFRWPRWCSGNTRACGALVSGSNPGRGPSNKYKVKGRGIE